MIMPNTATDDRGMKLDQPPTSTASKVASTVLSAASGVAAGGSLDRTIFSVAGAILSAVGSKRRSMPGTIIAVVGGVLLYKLITKQSERSHSTRRTVKRRR